jgi:prepilin peptidase CpaA
MEAMYLALTPLVILLLVAARIDWRERRIPNELNLLMAVTGLASSAIWGSPVGTWMSLAGLVLGFAILVLPFAIGAVGGGDVKILAAAGAWLGPVGVLGAFMLAQLVSLVCALWIAARKGRLTQLVSNSTYMVANIALVKHVGIDHITEKGKQLTSVGRRLPYAVSLAIGVMAVPLLPIW